MRKQNKIGTVFLASMLALAGLGVSYAGFSDVITVQGTVETGTVTLEAIEYSGTWVFKVVGDGTGTLTGWEFPADEEVAIWRGIYTEDPDDWADTLEADLSGFDEVYLVSWSYARDGEGDEADVVMVFDNLFPCIYFMANIIVEYKGSIPGHVTIENLVGDSILNQLDSTWEYEVNRLPPWVPVDEWPLQMHNGDRLKIILTIHVPQNNMLQNIDAVFSFDINAIQWYDPCDFPPLLPKTIYIPEESDVKLGGGDFPGTHPSYWEVFPQLNQPDNDYSYPLNVPDFPVLGWCVSETEFINPNKMYSDVLYYNTLEAGLPTWPDHLPTGNGNQPWGFTVWDSINYIINNKKGTPQQQQDAIWYFMDGVQYPTDPGPVQEMIDEASDPVVLSAFLDGFPQDEDWVAVLLDFGKWPPGTSRAGEQYQWIFIEVDP